MEKLRTLAIKNNTSDASIFDLGNLIKADSIAEITEVMKSMEQKQLQAKQDEQNHEQQLQQQKEQADAQALQAANMFKAQEDDKHNQTMIVVAQISAAGSGNGQDVNQNNISDYNDSLAQIQKEQAYQDTMDLKRESQSDKRNMHQDNMQLGRERVSAEEDRSNKAFQIARINKNRFDKPVAKKK